MNAPTPSPARPPRAGRHGHVRARRSVGGNGDRCAEESRAEHGHADTATRRRAQGVSPPGSACRCRQQSVTVSPARRMRHHARDPGVRESSAIPRTALSAPTFRRCRCARRHRDCATASDVGAYSPGRTRRPHAPARRPRRLHRGHSGSAVVATSVSTRPPGEAGACTLRWPRTVSTVRKLAVVTGAGGCRPGPSRRDGQAVGAVLGQEGPGVRAAGRVNTTTVLPRSGRAGRAPGRGR